MLNRLLESWLDSASERSYQSPFCQMLSAQGHIILHTTRHCALEYGKDVITKNPEGILCAYQLKANPGSRLTLTQFREIQGQLVQLITQPIVIPGVNEPHHKSYLVTNGEVDEEVHRAVDDLNRAYCNTESPGYPIEIISKGVLFSWASKLGMSLWPSEFVDVNRLLKFLVMQGNEMFPLPLFHRLLETTLFLGVEYKRNPTANEIRRHITSSAILTAVCLKNFSLRQNHFAVICAWVMFCSYSISVCERYGKSFSRNAGKAIEIAVEEIFANLSRLCDDLVSKENCVEGNALTDSIVYKGRFTLVVALMSIYSIWSEERGWIDEKHKVFLQEFIPKDQRKLCLWGEGVIPQYLVHMWYIRTVDATIRPDILLASLLKHIMNFSLSSSGRGLPSPYYSFSDIVRHTLRGLLPYRQDPFQDDSFNYRSHYALPLMHLLVRTNMKQQCKAFWPSFSRLNFNSFIPEHSWMFCLCESPLGKDVLEQPKLTKDWKELVTEARDVSGEGIPEALKSNKYLLALFLILCPNRGTPSAIRYIARQFDRSWFISEPIG